MELKGSKTEQNLMTAFAGESQARNKYTYFASKAKKDGYEQIAAIFEETANNEKEHAKLWFKYLHDGKVPSTIENLKDAVEGVLLRGGLGLRGGGLLRGRRHGRERGGGQAGGYCRRGGDSRNVHL